MAINQQRFITHESKTILGAFGLKENQLICLVGGGGKSSTMYELSHSLAVNNYTVITTSTTHIMRPTEETTEYLITKQPGETLDIEQIKKYVDKYKNIAIINEANVDGELRVKGIEPEELDKLHNARVAHAIVCEADGASQRPIKCPRDTEPVIPSTTDIVIPVVGMDALYATIGSDKTFRDEYICKVTGLNMGDELDEEAIAKIVTDEHGLAQYAPLKAEIIPFLNKIDITGKRSGVDLAKEILSVDHLQINKVVIGALHDLSRGFTIIEKA